jgi:polyhydroxybutyrate depolymerase
MNRMLFIVGMFCCCGLLPAAEPVRREWTIDGVTREAILSIPDSANREPAPVVFAFHGHGGTARNAARTFRYHVHWPEAICVYMQGLNTPGQLTDPEGKKPGWQKSAGDQGDRDLKFFDEVLKSLKTEYQIDEQRIYSTGHSNGGGFTYLLWSERGDVFAAMAPSGSAALRLQKALKPKPMLHVAGDNDPLVKYQWQTLMINNVKKINQCEDGKPWHGGATLFESKIGAPVVTFVTQQGHKFPQEAPSLIVRFFKEHKRDSESASELPSAEPEAASR